jgi:hypothetical protein
MTAGGAVLKRSVAVGFDAWLRPAGDSRRVTVISDDRVCGWSDITRSARA